MMPVSPALTVSCGWEFEPSPHSTSPANRHHHILVGVCWWCTSTTTTSGLFVRLAPLTPRSVTPPLGVPINLKIAQNIMSFKMKVSTNHKIIKSTSFGRVFTLKDKFSPDAGKEDVCVWAF